MAVDFRDPRSGFRHREVVMFINEEVLGNGGGPDFYLTFRSRPWSEIEDNLQSVVADPQVSRAIKRACAWSALALGVRVAARQREQQSRRARRLREQVEEHEEACWALASELERLREEREDVVSQLHGAKDDLQQTLKERDELHQRLIQFELSQEIQPESPAEQPGTEAWSLNAEEQSEVLAPGSQGGQEAEAQMAPPEGVKRPPSTWAQVVQPPLPMPCSISFPRAFPYPTPPPPRVMSAGVAGASVPAPVPTRGIYSPGLQLASARFRGGVAQQWEPRSRSQEEGPVRPQGMAPLRGRRNRSQEESPVSSRFRNRSEHSCNQGSSRK